MKNASTIYRLLKTSNTSWYDIRIIQGENVYGLDRLKSITISPSLSYSSGISIGNANSAQCDITLIEQSANWPRMAKFTLQFRIFNQTGVLSSEWIDFGSYYTDERYEDKYGNLSITGFDKMLTYEQSWTDKIPEQLLPASYPITAYAWAYMIQQAGLATFKDLTQLDDNVAFVGLDTTTTIRDVLKTIAAAHAGNWTITTDEKLNLVQFVNLDISQALGNEYTDLGKSMANFEDSPALSPVTGVHLETEAGTVVECGNDTGYRVKAYCDFASTTGVAELCFSRIAQYVYRPFSAVTAYLDPITDIGDTVVIDNTVYQLISAKWYFSKSPVADIAAPYDQEIDHEYMIVSPEAKNYRKTMSSIDNKLEDYVGWSEVSTAIEQNAESVVIAASGTYVTQTEYDAEIALIQSQIDGNIQSWSGNVVPTLNNAPASSWTTSADKASHVGDMYFVNSDSGIPEAGNYYRFEENNGVYSWQLITDSAITEALSQAAAALAAAEQAQDDADAASAEAQLRGRVFVVQPTPPYSVGDLWFNSDQSVIKVCMTARDTGSFVDTDWVKRDKYTDDSAFNAFQASYSQTIAAIQDQVDKKAETYYQDTDPVAEWGSSAVAGIAIAGLDVVGIDETVSLAHKGDLWYRTTDNTTWYWNGTAWEQQDVPDEVFDKIDGKAQIFIVQPYPPYNVGDLWFDSANSDIMTCINARETGSFAAGDWQKRNKYTDDSALNNFVNAIYTPEIASIQANLDGKIDTYFYNYDPTLSNIPASEWDTDSKKDTHIDDLFYNTSNGYTYRFSKSGNTYSWVRVKDSDITSAMQAASTAQDTADGKRRVFVSQPTNADEYDVGDLWVNATYGSTYSNDILKCKTHKDAGATFNISHWEKASKYTDDSSFTAFVNSVYTPEIAAIQSNLDGKIDTYFYAHAPTLQNAPASSWTTSDLKDAHVDDLFYDTVSGYSYRFTKSGSTYSWERIKDSDITSAMSAASTAQDTADGKRRVFVSQPTNADEYDIGDLWVNATYGTTYSNDLLRCKTHKDAGASFNIAHWELASKYTDDTAANAVQQELTTFESSFTVQPNQIAAEINKHVIKDKQDTKTTFGWLMDDTSHTWYANNQQVMKIQQSGLSVTGSITATSGYIGNGVSGFEINATNIHNGMTSLSDTEHYGVYIGTDGIALGKGAFKVTSQGAVTASNLDITGGSISIGGTSQNPVFQVSSYGAVTASNISILGGSIAIRDSNNNIIFSADSTGVYVNGNGTFTGTVYAGNIVSGATVQGAGYFDGSGIVTGSIDGGQYGQVAQFTLDDYNIARVGDYGAITTASLSSGVQGSLYQADLFGLATTAGGSTYPAYFCATSITALSSMYANEFYIELGGDRQLALKTHYHTVTVNQDGTVQFGQPTNTRPDPFNIADTEFFEDYVSAIDVSSITISYPDGETSYPYYDSPTLGKIIEFKANYVIQDGSGTTLTGGSFVKTVPATAAYDAGYDDGEDSVTVTNITRTYPDGETSYPYYDSQTLGKIIEFKAIATMSNGHSGSQTLTVPATAAYNAGYSAGETAGVDSVTVSTITRTYPDGESSYPYYDSPTLGKIIEFKAIATMSNGHSGSQILTVPAGSAYNAGYSAGEQSGIGSVTATAPTLDTSWATSSTGYIYRSAQKTYEVRVKSNASNGDSLSGSVIIGASAAYNAGAETAYVLSAIGGAAGTPTYDSTDEIWLSNVAVTATARGTYADGTYYTASPRTINTSVNVTTVYNAGYTAGSGSGAGSVTVQTLGLDPDQSVSYSATVNNYYIPIKAVLTNNNYRTTTLTVSGQEAYDAGEAAGEATGAASVTVTSISRKQDDAYQTNSHNTFVYVQAEASNGARKDNVILTVSGANAYNAGVTDGQGSVTASATGMTTSSSNYTEYDQAIGLSASSVYAVSGTQYGRIQVSLSNGTSRVIRIGIPDTSTSVTVSSVTGITTDSSDYTSYDYAVSRGESAMYVTDDYMYGRATITLSNGVAKTLRFRTPNLYGQGVNAVGISSVTAISTDSTNYIAYDYAVSRTASTMYTSGSYSYGRATVTLSNGVAKTIRFTVPAGISYGGASVIATSSSNYNSYDTACNITDSYAYVATNYRYGRIQITDSNGNALATVRVRMDRDADPSGSVTISASTGLTTNSSTYTTYDRAVNFAASSLYTSGSTQYARVQVTLSNGVSQILRVGTPAGSSVTSIVLGDYGSEAYSSTLYYYKQNAAGTLGTIKAVAQPSGFSADLNVTTLVQTAYNAGYAAGGGGGGGPSNSVTLTCSQISHSSGQYYDYRFVASLAGSTRFTQGRSYTFYYY